MELNGMNNKFLIPSKIKKKSSSLPTGCRLETVDHLAAFKAYEKEKNSQKITHQRSESLSGCRYSCLPLKSFEGNHFSQHESSLSSDTSCSSLEFHRPEEWQEKLSQQKQSTKLPEEEQRLFSFVFGLSDFNSPVQSNKLSGTYIPLKRNQHMYLSIQDKNDKRESTISSVSSKSSTDSWTRKERREALKARVEAKREQLGDSSSEEEMPQKHSRCYSDIGLHRNICDDRLKSVRSERYKRRSQDEASVRCFGRSDKVVDLYEKHASESVRKPPLAPYSGTGYNWQESNIYKDLTVKEEKENCQRTEDNIYETKASNFEMSNLLDKTRSVSSLARFARNLNVTKEKSQVPNNTSSSIYPDISFSSAAETKYLRASPRTQQGGVIQRKFSLPINLWTRVTSTTTTGRESLVDTLITPVSGSIHINSRISASCSSLHSEICSKDGQTVQRAFTPSSVVGGSSLMKEPPPALNAPNSSLCNPPLGETFKPLPNNSHFVTCSPPVVQTLKPIQIISHPIMSDTFVGQTTTPSNTSHLLNQALAVGRAPTPPPRSPQSKIVFNEAVHQLCTSQPNLINRSLLKHTESQKGIDKDTVNCNPSISQMKFRLSTKYSNSGGKIQPFPKREEKIGNTCVNDTSFKGKMSEKETSQYPKKSNNSTASKNNMIYSYTDMPSKQILASVINYSKSSAPMYSYTDQAPLSKTFLNKNFPEKTDVLLVDDSQKHVENSTDFVRTMSDIQTRQRNRMTVSNNKFNVQVPKIYDYLAKPDEVKTSKQEQSQVNSNCEMTASLCSNPVINYFNRDTRYTLKTSDNCALPKSRSKCSSRESIENNASSCLPAKVHSGSTLSLEIAKKQIDEFVQRERKKKFSENFVDAINELQEMYNSLRFTDEELVFQEQKNSHPPPVKDKCAQLSVSQECKDSSVLNCAQTIDNKMKSFAGYPLTRSSSDGKNQGLKSEVKSKTESLLNVIPSSDTPYRRRSSVSNNVFDDSSFINSTPRQDIPFTTTQKKPEKFFLQYPELVLTTKTEESLNDESQSSHMDQTKGDKFHKKATVYKTTYSRPLSNIPHTSFTKHFNTESEKREKITFLEKTHLKLRNEIDFQNSSKDWLNNNNETIDKMFVDCEKKKKHRAVRSLSANIANIAFNKELDNNVKGFERAQSITADAENCLFSGKNHEASSNWNTTKSLMEMSTNAQEIKDIRVFKHMSDNFVHENISDRQIVSQESQCIGSAEKEHNIVSKNIQLRKNIYTYPVTSDYINLKVTQETQDQTSGRANRPKSLKLNSPKVVSVCHRICQSTPSLIKQIHPERLLPRSKYFQPQVIHELKHSIAPLDERQLDDLLSTLVSNSNSRATEYPLFSRSYTQLKDHED